MLSGLKNNAAARSTAAARLIVLAFAVASVPFVWWLAFARLNRSTATRAESTAPQDEVSRRLKMLGPAYERGELSKRYPLGYRIFRAGHEPKDMFTYESTERLPDYVVDWNEVSITRDTDAQIELRLPDVRHRDGAPVFQHVVAGGLKRVGLLGSAGFGGDPSRAGISMFSEVLSLDQGQGVFLVGFQPRPAFATPPDAGAQHHHSMEPKKP